MYLEIILFLNETLCLGSYKIGIDWLGGSGEWVKES